MTFTPDYRTHSYQDITTTVSTRRKRDTQGPRVWEALRTVDNGRVFTAQADVTKFASRVASSKWWADHNGPVIDQLSLPRVVVPKDERRIGETTELLVLKRMSHYLVADDVAWHGVEWVQLFLSMVSRFMGVAQRKAVTTAFRAHNVKMRQLSPEAKEAMRRRRTQKEIVAMMQELKDG